jgi:hypothetical protein
VLQISDTVVVKPSGAPVENMCSQATKAWDRVSYIIDEQEVSHPSVVYIISTKSKGRHFRSEG